MAALVLTTGEENAGQEMSVPVPGRSSPLRVRPTPGSELPLSPLSTVLFADLGTTTPVAQQNGSIATPFGTLQQAVDAIGTGFTIELTPGDYGSGVVVEDKSVTIVGMGTRGSFNQPTIGGVDATDAAIYFQSVAVYVEGVGNLIEFRDCQAGGDFSGGGSDVNAWDTQFTGALDAVITFRAFNCDVGILSADDAFLDSCDISGNIEVANTLTIRNVRTVQPGLTLTATSIVVDSHTLRELVFAGTTFVGAVTGFEGTVITWGANVATTGGFLNLGTRVNPLSVTIDPTLFLAARRGVLCRLTAYSPVDTVVTAFKDFGATALSCNPNNGVASDTDTFIEYAAGESFAMGVSGTAGGAVTATAIFV